MVQFPKKDKTATADLTSAALNYTTDYNNYVRIQNVNFHFSEAVSETVKVTLDSKNGANYDIVKREVVLVGEKDYVYTPDQGEGSLDLQKGDELKIECTKANVTGSVFVTVKAKELN